MRTEAAMKKNVLLINMGYSGLKAHSVIYEIIPSLSLSTLAAVLLERGHKVYIWDFSLNKHDEVSLLRYINDLSLDYIGVTATTPSFPGASRISRLLKQHFPKIPIICGGIHVTQMPNDALCESSFDIVVRGEGDFSFSYIVDGYSLSEIKGISYREKNKILHNPPQEPISDLDVLPFAANNIFPAHKYKTSRLLCRRRPVAYIESSRGCPYQCVFCASPVIHGYKFRFKSPERVVEEMASNNRWGFRELQMCDDCFTFDIERAEEICKMIISRKLKFSWSISNGTRVDTVNKRLLGLLAKSGCYRISFGIESGNQHIIKRCHKNQDLEQIERAVRLAKESGLETFGFFMLGLPGETETTMRQTVKFAKNLRLDFAKVSFFIPFPGSALFSSLKEQESIKSFSWSDYALYNIPATIYDLPGIPWNIGSKYFYKFYRDFYLRPDRLMNLGVKAARHGFIWEGLKIFKKFLSGSY